MKNRLYISFRGFDYRPDIQLRIWPAEERYRADVIDEFRCSQIRIDVTSGDVVRLATLMAQKIQEVSNNVDDLKFSPKQSREALEALAKTGHEVFVEVFGEYENDMRNLIETSRRADRPLILQITSEGFAIPWELMYPDSLDLPLSFKKFWGFDHVVSRIVALSSRPAAFVANEIRYAARPRVGLLANLTLQSVASDELPYFEQLSKRTVVKLDTLERLDPKLHAEGMRTFKAFLGQPLDITHFACHGSRNSQDDRLQQIVLSDEFAITLGDMLAYDIALGSHPLVVMNGCETGNVNPQYAFHFAAYFMKKGARGLVGTECEVPDEFATRFAQSLYSKLLKGRPLGEAVLRTRHDFLKRRRNPLGLIYCSYAPPSIRLVAETAPK
jgi:hypothetical protein